MYGRGSEIVATTKESFDFMLAFFADCPVVRSLYLDNTKMF